MLSLALRSLLYCGLTYLVVSFLSILVIHHLCKWRQCSLACQWKRTGGKWHTSPHHTLPPYHGQYTGKSNIKCNPLFVLIRQTQFHSIPIWSCPLLSLMPIESASVHDVHSPPRVQCVSIHTPEKSCGVCVCSPRLCRGVPSPPRLSHNPSVLVLRAGMWLASAIQLTWPLCLSWPCVQARVTHTQAHTASDRLDRLHCCLSCATQSERSSQSEQMKFHPGSPTVPFPGPAYMHSLVQRNSISPSLVISLSCVIVLSPVRLPCTLMQSI